MLRVTLPGEETVAFRADRRQCAAAPRRGLGRPRGGALRRPRRAPRAARRPRRPAHPARRRPRLHRPRLPARHARDRRHAAGRLRARAVVSVLARLRRPRRRPRQRHALSLRRRPHDGLRARQRRPLRLTLLTDPSPAARLRRHLHATGLPPVLPEWGYGFWKSRDVYGHQTEVEDDFHGCADNAIPLDALVLDSPWETQYNTWIPNPHQFTDFTGMVRDVPRGRRAHRRLGDAVGERRLLRGPDAARPRVARAAPRARVQLRRRRAGGHYVRGADGEPFVTRWWMGTGSPIDFTSPAAETWWREQAKTALRLGVEGIKADDGEGYYFPDDVRFADGGTRRGRRLARRRPVPALDAARARRGPPRPRRALRPQRLDRPAGDRDALGRRPGVGLLVAARARRRDDLAPPRPASRTGRTTSAATSATASSSAARPSCSCAGRSWAASRRSCRRTGGWSRSRGPTTSARCGIYRSYVLLHERLVPYIRAAAATAAAQRPADHPPAAPHRPRRRPRLDGRRRLRLRPRAVGRAGARRGRALARGRAAARRLDRGLVGRARARRRRGRRARAARARSRSGCAAARSS